MPGTQAQNVIFVALDDLQDTSTEALALPLAELAGAAADPPLPPQAARSDTAATPAIPAAARLVVNLGPLGWCLREVRYISAELLVSNHC
jgi:hypothetical protein